MASDGHDAYLESRVLAADPIELVNMLYQGAIQAVQDARRHLAECRIADRSRAINKACQIVIELAVSLDHERGGEISQRLALLYDYMQRRLLEANIKQSDEPLADVLGLLTTLSQAWEGVRISEGALKPEKVAAWSEPAAEPAWSEPGSQRASSSDLPESPAESVWSQPGESPMWASTAKSPWERSSQDWSEPAPESPWSDTASKSPWAWNTAEDPVPLSAVEGPWSRPAPESHLSPLVSTLEADSAGQPAPESAWSEPTTKSPWAQPAAEEIGFSAQGWSL